MSCIEARALLHDLAAGELDGTRASETRAHADACDACGAELAELEATLSVLQRAGNEPLPDGFALALHRALVAAGAPRPTLLDRVRLAIARHPVTWFACAASVAALIAVGGTVAVVHHGVTPAQASYRVPASKTALVKIDFVADRAIDGVAFEITLPDGLRFVSGGTQLAERSFRFQGKLNAGSNPIPVAVKGPRAGRYTVIAHAVGAELDVTQQVVLEVTT
jgi:anti-sigma factor RsiW